MRVNGAGALKCHRQAVTCPVESLPAGGSGHSPTELRVRARKPGSGARSEYKKGETLIPKGAKPVLFAALAALSALAQAQSAPALALPVDCQIGRACIVQNYVDRDPGPGARDYRCGFLT